MTHKELQSQFKNLTIMETPETDELEKVIYNKKTPFISILTALILVDIFFIVFSAVQPSQTILIIFALISCLITAIVYTIYRYTLKPYFKLLKLAKLNDRVRHEERLRIRERERYEQNKNNKKIPIPPKPKSDN